MKFKLVPEPPDSLAFVAAAHRAVPLTPGTESDCCARLVRRTDLSTPDEARTWLTFLRALGLARETAAGFAREDAAVDAATLGPRFRERVFGADAVLDELAAAGPLSADAAFERFEPSVPTWERHKHPNEWRTVWRERVERLMEWAVLLELATRTDDGYAVAERASDGDAV